MNYQPKKREKRLVITALTTITILTITTIVALTLLFVGCDDAMNMTDGVIGPSPKTEPTAPVETPPETTNEPPAVTMGEVKTEEPTIEPETPAEEPTPPADTTPPTVVEVGWYHDWQMTEPITDDVRPGDTIYTVVMFSEAMQHIAADDNTARPALSITVDYKPTKYKVRSYGAKNIRSGEVRPISDDTYLCKYTLRANAAGRIALQVELNTADVAGNTVTEARVYVAPFGIKHRRVEVEPIGSCPFGPEWVPTTDTNKTGFVGRILSVLPVQEIDKGVVRVLPGVTVTILSGPKSGESTVSDENGYYHFPDVNEDELHLRVEKHCFETKEVLVSKTRRTAIMPGRHTPNYGGRFNLARERKVPGTITMGHAWPERIKKLLRQITVPHDTLYLENQSPLPYSGAQGLYATQAGFVITAGISSRPADLLSVLAHELAHARQHAIVAIDGSGSLMSDWNNSPEGIAYEEARRKDWEEYGDDVLSSDNPYYRARLTESSAEFMSHFWLVTILKDEWEQFYAGPDLHEQMKKYAPHRLAWAEEWHNRTKP